MGRIDASIILTLEMLGIVVTGWVLLVAAGITREIQWSRDRAKARSAVRALAEALETSNNTTRRLQEDLYVLQTVFRERNLISKGDLQSARRRLVEAPKRVAAERDAIQRNLDIGVPPHVIEDSLGKLH